MDFIKELTKDKIEEYNEIFSQTYEPSLVEWRNVVSFFEGNEDLKPTKDYTGMTVEFAYLHYIVDAVKKDMPFRLFFMFGSMDYSTHFCGKDNRLRTLVIGSKFDNQSNNTGSLFD